jgi:uncharacterized membrane protein YcaP (DUF421 family)
MEHLLQLAVPWWELVVRPILIYVAFLIGLRLFGKREVGQFTMFDLVVLLLVANALQPAITGPDASVLGGVIIIATLLLFNRGLALARNRFPAVDRLVSPQPSVLVRDGKWFPQAMDREGLSVQDVEMALREHGVDKIEEVKEAVLEEDGTISVVPKAGTGLHRRVRRVRFLRQH